MKVTYFRISEFSQLFL